MVQIIFITAFLFVTSKLLVTQVYAEESDLISIESQN
jgi:hypothetical protein